MTRPFWDDYPQFPLSTLRWAAMSQILPKVLGFILFALCAAIFISEVMNSYHRYLKHSEAYPIPDKDDVPKKEKQMKTFFSLYHNMDEIIEQNNEVSAFISIKPIISAIIFSFSRLRSSNRAFWTDQLMICVTVQTSASDRSCAMRLDTGWDYHSWKIKLLVNFSRSHRITKWHTVWCTRVCLL